MIKLTAPNGKPVEVDPKSINSMRQNDGGYTVKAKTVLSVMGEHLAVIETMEEIDRLIASDG
jgi:uncharacterized protein YlzI (FlbEa/FlbD family)